MSFALIISITVYHYFMVVVYCKGGIAAFIMGKEISTIKDNHLAWRYFVTMLGDDGIE